MIKKILKYKYLYMFIAFSALFIIYYCITKDYSADNLWNMHNAQKLYNGFVPYREFSMIVTPLFHIIGALFIRVLGNNVFSFHIYGGILLGCSLTLFLYIIKKTCHSPKANLVLVPIFMAFLVAAKISYNWLCMIWILLLIIIELKIPDNFNYKWILNGFIIALIFLTKQNIGVVYACFYFLYLILNKNIDNKSIKALIFVGTGIISIVPFIIYLVCSNSLFDFFDLCILGMLDFGKSNAYSTTSAGTPIMIIVVILVLLELVKSIKTKNRQMTYISCLSICNFFFVIPFIDFWHLFIALMPFIIGLIWFIKQNVKTKALKQTILCICIGLTLTCFFVILLFFGYCIATLRVVSAPSEYEFYEAAKGIDVDYFDCWKQIKNYIDKSEGEGKNVILAYENASMVLLPFNTNNKYFDTLLTGNFGYGGEQKVIEKIQNIENVKIILGIGFASKHQTCHKIKQFVQDNYKLVDYICGMPVYEK
ncbi:MAG: glycosyltransferase family 39 protein [Clostridia bacterium]|nr:glycosyltransferase family 39 protein [Clostridia bacterium]